MKTQYLALRRLEDRCSRQTGVEQRVPGSILVLSTPEQIQSYWLFLIRLRARRPQTNKTKMTYIAIINDDKSGSVYGVGTSEETARQSAVDSGFESNDGIAVEITESSYNAIKAGNPDALECFA